MIYVAFAILALCLSIIVLTILAGIEYRGVSKEEREKLKDDMRIW